jgi:hypothetical protein
VAKYKVSGTVGAADNFSSSLRFPSLQRRSEANYASFRPRAASIPRDRRLLQQWERLSKNLIQAENQLRSQAAPGDRLSNLMPWTSTLPHLGQQFMIFLPGCRHNAFQMKVDFIFFVLMGFFFLELGFRIERIVSRTIQHLAIECQA